MFESFQGILLRIPADKGQAMSLAGKSLQLAGTNFDLEPLFDVPASRTALVTAERQWVLARGGQSISGENPWEFTHESLGSLGAAAGVMPDFIEPDLQQQWPHADLHQQETGVALGDACVFEDQEEEFPRRPGAFAWHLGDTFSQLRTARNRAGNEFKVRIAHLDTGYDASHKTYPGSQIDKEIQRNFIDRDRPNDASDQGVDGILRNPGHGAGTLSILAGGRFKFISNGYQFNEILGGAPDARIVPLRVGNSVVQLTTSAVAQGINYVAELNANPTTRVDVISMSMGGVASAAWADAVNKAYLAGIVYVAAAGNNYSSGFFGFPTRHIVYPARFRRVIAACGVMADGKPYYGLRAGTMQGNWGPPRAMETTMAAFTPNMPWARWGCDKIVLMTGAGTSSATPQIAAAAALYIQRYAGTLFDKSQYPEPWMRVEAVREALFGSARSPSDMKDQEKLGQGILQAADALERVPPDAFTLRMTPSDRAGFPFLNVLSRRGLSPTVSDRMLQLEATQLVNKWKLDKENPFESSIGDPDLDFSQVDKRNVVKFLDAVRECTQASQPLKDRCKLLLDGMTSRSTKKRKTRPKTKDNSNNKGAADEAVKAQRVEKRHLEFKPPIPTYRKLRGYALDPSLALQLDTASISEVTFNVPWESLEPGPKGEYLEVVDIDPPSRLFYEPVNLDDPLLLAQDGLPPSDGVPQFHQQMVYAVASLTIRNFERALGRQALWRHGPPPSGKNPKNDSHFVQRLRIYPHALREPNAFYSPSKIALLFGYFNATSGDNGDLPGRRVFTCLSHDIIAHETVHALLDGMHRTFLIPTNRDVHAFHEAFADCVAMLQHFTFPDVLEHQIANTHGEIDVKMNLLVSLAGEFGHATGRRMSLRDAIGHVNDKGEWEYTPPNPDDYETVEEPHERGLILVRAVFDAFLSIYRNRIADLIRLASGGTGILRTGALPPDLTARLASEAAKSAQHVLQMCIRALDYCPPTDITFGEYLRAIITADQDLIPDDKYGYRVSFVEAFRSSGIYPPGIRTMSIGSLLWRNTDEEDRQPSEQLSEILRNTRSVADKLGYASTRKEAFLLQRQLRYYLYRHLREHFAHENGQQDAAYLGIDPDESFEVHTARVALRSRPDGTTSPQLLIGLLQDIKIPVAPDDPNGIQMTFEGGCTVVADLRELRIRYCIRKRTTSTDRRRQQQAFALKDLDSLQATYLGIRNLDTRAASPSSPLKEPFALIHRTL